MDISFLYDNNRGIKLSYIESFINHLQKEGYIVLEAYITFSYMYLGSDDLFLIRKNKRLLVVDFNIKGTEYYIKSDWRSYRGGIYYSLKVKESLKFSTFEEFAINMTSSKIEPPHLKNVNMFVIDYRRKNKIKNILNQIK